MRGSGAQTGDASMNAPCPCGSGKKFKKCCLRTRSRELREEAEVGAYVETCVGVINFGAVFWRDGNLTAGAAGNALCWVRNLAIPFKCTSSEASLFGVLVARNAYIPIALSPFYLALGVLQD